VARPGLWIRLLVAAVVAAVAALWLALAAGPQDGRRLTTATAPPPNAAAPVQPRPPSAKAAPSVRTFRLERETPREKELAVGTADAYEIDLDSGQYLHFHVEQLGVDVAIDVFPPSRPRWFRADSPNGSQGPEEVYLVADRPGRYRLVVVAMKPGAHGRYLARLAAVRPASFADHDRAAAQLAAAEAAALPSSPGSFWQAAAGYEKALRLWQGLGDLQQQAWVLHSLGKLYFENGRSADALAVFLRHLAVTRLLRHDFDQAIALNGMGRAFGQLGDFASARSSYEKALAIWRSHHQVDAEVTTSINLGVLLQSYGKPWEALTCFRGARDLAQQGKLTKGEINALNGMGWVYASEGDWQRASAAREQALSLANQTKDKQLRIITLRQLGDAHLAAGEPEKALLYLRRALDLLDDPEAASERALLLDSIGLCLQQQGAYEQALDAFRKALAVFEQSNNAAATDARINLGRAYVRLHRPEQALAQYGQALDQARREGDRTLESVARFGMATAERERGNLILALAHADAALQIVEALRAEALRPDLQRSYLAWHETYFDLLVEIQMARHRQQPGSGFDRLAFERSEQARARQLFDALAAKREIRAGLATAGPAPRARRDRLTAEISVQDRIRRRPEVSPADAAAAQRRLSELLDQLHDFDAATRRGISGVAVRAEGSTPSPLSLAGTLLDSDTVLLEYYLQEPRSFLWVVSSNGRVRSYELPGRRDIETRVRSLVGLLSGTDQRCWTLPDAGRDAAARESAELGRILLGQVGGDLDGKQLAIAASGALQYLPFAALLDPGGREEPLALRHAIVYVPSLTVLGALRERAGSRQPAAGLLAMIADPVFGASDPRLRGTPAWKPRPAAGELPRLTQSRAEADAILGLVPDARVLLRTGFEASPELVTGGALDRYRILHCATHGTDQVDQPEMSAIELSAFDSRGNPRDGYLRAKDVAGLDLGADLVVLSACSTALAPEIDREGMFGLAQGFLAAGARQVLVSLWNVGDLSTAELMQRFYRHLLDRHQPLPAGAALRLAQQEMWQQPRWRSPDHWAGFVLEGDWR
jgi:CHAT domain-containing protein/tetratricopeptide (TPR) repeat protein